MQNSPKWKQKQNLISDLSINLRFMFENKKKKQILQDVFTL